MSDFDTDTTLNIGESAPLFGSVEAEDGGYDTILSATYQMWLLPSGEPVAPPIGLTDYTTPISLPSSNYDSQPAEVVRAWYLPNTTNLPEADYEFEFLINCLGDDGVTRNKSARGIVRVVSIP
jgi:hypothetical protein